MKIQLKVLFLFLCMFLSICLCACTEKGQTGNTDNSGASENQSEIQKEESEETSNPETTAEQAVNKQRPYSEDMDWLDYVISCAADVDIDEITDEIYQSVECIYINLVRRTRSDTFEYEMRVDLVDSGNTWNAYRIKEGQNGFSFPDVISIRNPEKYTGLRSFDFTNQLSDDLSDFHAVDWNSICQLTSLKKLDIEYYNDYDVYHSEKKTFTQIEDISCFSDLEEVEFLCLGGIDLPTDISDLFFRRNDIWLVGCNITEDSFETCSRFQELPMRLVLSKNNIKDARKVIALVKNDETGIQDLSLVGNPLEEIGNPDSIDNIEFDEETCIRLGLDKKFPDYYFWNFCVD